MWLSLCPCQRPIAPSLCNVWLCILCRGDSSSRSSSPEKEARIEYITSFGGEDKQKQVEHHPASSSRGGLSGSNAMMRGGAGGSSRSRGMGGGRRDSGRGDDARRQPGSSSRSRYSDQEWRSDSRRHRYAYVVWWCVVIYVVCDYSLLSQVFV